MKKIKKPSLWKRFRCFFEFHEWEVSEKPASKPLSKKRVLRLCRNCGTLEMKGNLGAWERIKNRKP